MVIRMLVVGPFAANCYIVGSSATRQGMIIDPGAEADKILGGMLRNEVVKGEAYDNRTKTIEETTYGFRLGRD